jgi:hypothetical protein
MDPVGRSAGDGARRRRRLTTTMFVTAIACLIVVARASAAPAKFTLEYCDPAIPQTSDPFLTFAVNPPEGVPIHWFNDCLKPGGSIGIQEVGNSEDANAVLSVYVPATPGGYVESEAIAGGTAALGVANNGVYINEPGWPFPNGGEDLRVFHIRSGPPLSGDPSGNFTIGWNCVAALGGCGAGPIVYARDITVTEIDPVPPTVSAGGELLSGQVARGRENLAATANDVGGGISKIEVLVNGLAVAPATLGSCATVGVANRAYEGVAAVSPSPCPPTLEGAWNVNTAEYPFRGGANTVQVCASDFATTGTPNTTCSAAQTVEVDNSCTESPVGGGQSLDAAFARAQTEAVTLRYGKGAEISGTLTGGSNQPISGATICVQTQAEGAETGLVPVGTATTDSAGDFSYVLGQGPNRQILFGYRHSSFQVTRTLTVFSHARATLKAGPKKLRNGQRVELTGSLPEPKAAGRVVVLQANVPGSHRWITFRKATTGERGRFKADYHFTSTTRKIIYRFRAVVPHQAGYPWLQGTSRPVSVSVRG